MYELKCRNKLEPRAFAFGNFNYMEVLPASQRFDQSELCSGMLSTSKNDQSELNATFNSTS